jgi:hypothetical protein
VVFVRNDVVVAPGVVAKYKRNWVKRGPYFACILEKLEQRDIPTIGMWYDGITCMRVSNYISREANIRDAIEK